MIRLPKVSFNLNKKAIKRCRALNNNEKNRPLQLLIALISVCFLGACRGDTHVVNPYFPEFLADFIIDADEIGLVECLEKL